MSAARDLLQGAVARIAGALSFNRFASCAEDRGKGAAEVSPTAAERAEAEDRDYDLRDRERELRVLMSNWM